jgi:biotin synthase
MGPTGELFAQAVEINMKKKKRRASPSILEERCGTTPPCRHCKWEYFKKTGRQTGRPRSVEETVRWAKNLENSGIDRTFAASGWMGYETPPDFLAHVSAIRENTRLEVYGLFGALSKQSLRDLREAGLEGYLCSLESPSEEVYRSFRPGGDSLDDRLRALDWAETLGLKRWSGFLIGLGESEKDIETGLGILKDLAPESISILPFTPFPYTPMQAAAPANPMLWARAAAAATLLIPAADIFTDQTTGVYGPYSDLFKPNGVYDLPRQ